VPISELSKIDNLHLMAFMYVSPFAFGRLHKEQWWATASADWPSLQMIVPARSLPCICTGQRAAPLHGLGK